MGKHSWPKSKGKKQDPFLCILFSMLLILWQSCSYSAKAGSIVKFLPGFEGPLPFELETGYIGVGESEDVQLFYYFIKSESNPETDPLMIWLSGGPGCSSFSGLALEIGPIAFQPFLYDGSLPKLMLNPYSWTKVASIIFVDQPVGTGFSYATTAAAYNSDCLRNSDQLYEFLWKWLMDHPDFISNPFYISGDSAGGLVIPILTQLISNGNEIGIEPKINLKGYLAGNPMTFEGERNYIIPHAHALGLISNELYQSLKDSCNGEYQRIDPSNALCLQHKQTFNQLLNNINSRQVLEPNCPLGSPESNEKYGGRRSNIEVLSQRIKVRQPTPIKCHADGDRLLYYWSNDEQVQEALHIRNGSIGEWVRCNLDLPYTKVKNVIPYHANLSSKGYRSLIYSGDHTLATSYFSTQVWIKSLNYQIVDDWRQWIVDGQVAGYARTYANQMTFATVKGGSHTPPDNRPRECQAMFKRWISYQPL